ncbi:MAG: nuclear transport factor 2 family protein [Candidatus Thorarchaeota archaeon]|nr:nuclear transport factor 2 family protein [Candidatus Thorarchaeota archaeon]
MENKEIDELMKKHFDASHSLDLDAFMETWADDASVEFLVTGRKIEGKEELRTAYRDSMFGPLTNLKTEIVHQVAHKNYRTYIERCTECSNADVVGTEVHWTLEFRDGKIQKGWTLQ